MNHPYLRHGENVAARSLTMSTTDWQKQAYSLTAPPATSPSLRPPAFSLWHGLLTVPLLVRNSWLEPFLPQRAVLNRSSPSWLDPLRSRLGW